MNKFCFFSLGLLMFTSCSEELGNNAPEPEEELVQVSFQAYSGEVENKSWYDHDKDNDKFYHTWKEGDEVNVIVIDPEALDLTDIRKKAFEAKSSGRSTQLKGYLKAWDEKRTLYAVHPHRTDFYDFQSCAENEGFLIEANKQVVDLASKDAEVSKSRCNSLLIAVEENVSFKKDADNKVDIDLDDLYFRQAMSYFKIDLTGLEGYTLNSVRIKKKGGRNTLLKNARISINEEDEKGQEPFIYTPEKTGQDIAAYDNALLAEVENHIQGTDATIYFALFPATLEDTYLVVRVADCNEKTYDFRMDLPTIEFKRNKFSYYPQPLNLCSDFEEVNTETSTDITSVY